MIKNSKTFYCFILLRGLTLDKSIITIKNINYDKRSVDQPTGKKPG